jgi:hypothetical protein
MPVDAMAILAVEVDSRVESFIFEEPCGSGG